MFGRRGVSPSQHVRVINAIDEALYQEGQKRNLVREDMRAIRPRHLPEEQKEALIAQVRQILSEGG